MQYSTQKDAEVNGYSPDVMEQVSVTDEKTPNPQKHSRHRHLTISDKKIIAKWMIETVTKCGSDKKIQ